MPLPARASAQPLSVRSARPFALSTHLRTATAAAHCSVEHALRLPQAITGRAAYVAYLRRSHAFHRPLEERLGRAGLPSRGRALRLAADLAQLDPGVPPPPDAPEGALPPTPSHSHAIGAFYVLEGAALGGQVILRALLEAAVDGVAGANAFLTGEGPRTGAVWHEVRALIDMHGQSHPEEVPAVVAGAHSTFAAVERWMDARHWRIA